MTLATDTLVSLDAIRAAADRISGIAVKTPLVRAYFPKPLWQRISQSRKPPAHRRFKLRGASNKILQLTPEEISRGVITYSSGNHAQGVAYAARAVGAKAVIVMPSNAPAIKRAATLAMGAEIVDVGVASSERLAKAETRPPARLHRHPALRRRQIITGQATCGLEIVEAPRCRPRPRACLRRRPPLRRRHRRQAPRPQEKVFGIEPELAGDTAESSAPARSSPGAPN